MTMLPLSQLLTVALVAVSASASAVVDLTPSNFDSVVLNSGRPALVEFFAPWCGHCKSLAPVYEELASTFEHAKDKVVIAKVDADAEKDLGKRFGVTGFPTLKWFPGGYTSEPEDYKSGRDLDSLSGFITQKTGVKPMAAKTAESHVRMLTDSTFDQEVGGDQNVIVAFTAPWCGHCKSLAPVWEKVAHDFAAEDSVVIAKVDCEAPNAKATAERFGVKSYPTIKFFAKGDSEGMPYTDGRSEQDVLNFMNEKAGTFRALGGGLNPFAGTIPSLDSVVETLKSASGEKAFNELYKLADQAKEKYAEYYSKVGKKLQENAGYVEKEYKRLSSILAKGNLTPEKLDDLTSRRNILLKFKGDDAAEEKSEL